MKKIILIIIMLITNLNFLYSQDVKKIIFKPSVGSTLTRNDVEKILYANGVDRDTRFECVIDSSVEEIGEYAFDCCNKLEAIEFSSNSQLKKIGEGAFRNSNITKIVIPSSVEEIERDAFSGSNLEKVVFAENSQLKKMSGFSNTGIKWISIPSSVEEIGNDAFNESIEEVYFAPNSRLKKIGINAFQYSNITKIVIPSSVEEIGEYAFASCPSVKSSKLVEVEFAPNSKLKKIGGRAFWYCKITKIAIPSSVEEIEDCAFESCQNLEEVEFSPNSKLKKIGHDAFYASKIKEITLPKSLKSIGTRILQDDYYHAYLKKVIFKSSVPPVFEYDDSIFHRPRLFHLKSYFSSRQPLTIKVPKGSKKKYKSALDIIIQEQIIDYFKRDLNRTYFSDREAAVLYDLIKIVE